MKVKINTIFEPSLERQDKEIFPQLFARKAMIENLDKVFNVVPEMSNVLFNGDVDWTAKIENRIPVVLTTPEGDIGFQVSGTMKGTNDIPEYLELEVVADRATYNFGTKHIFMEPKKPLKIRRY